MSSRRVVAVIQARMSSTRLPGKVLLELGDRSTLAWVIRAARAADEIDEVIVATSDRSDDDPIARECEMWECAVVRGSLTDVAGRFSLAARVSGADAVVRLTADCPLLDPRLIDQTVALWRSDPEIDYVATTLSRSLPRGLDVELLTRSALAHVDAQARGSERTHVTSMLYGRADVRRMGIVVAPPRGELRVTLDDRDDLALLRALIPLLPQVPPSWKHIVDVLDGHPELVRLNAHVRQKSLDEG